MIGGLAVQTHGHLRTTFDVDIYPDPTPENLTKLAAALNALDARVLNPGSEGVTISATMLPRATRCQLDSHHGAIDVLHDPPGAPPYELLQRDALRVTLADTEVKIAGLDDLISMKRASARPVDLDDLAALTERKLVD
ncbi:MAG: hypothetical protein ACR2GL_08540 [Thermoleophilaceae bacterium]